MSGSLKVYPLVLNAQVVLLMAHHHPDLLMINDLIGIVRVYPNEFQVIGHAIKYPVIRGGDQVVSRGAYLIVNAHIFG